MGDQNTKGVSKVQLKNIFIQLLGVMIFSASLVVAEESYHNALNIDAFYNQERFTPPFEGLRYGEDWSYLADYQKAQLPWWERAKYIAPFDEGVLNPLWFSFGGSLRVRADWHDHYFGTTNDDKHLVLTRALLHSSIHYSDWLRFFVEGKTAQASLYNSAKRQPSHMDTLALEQAFIEWKIFERYPEDIDFNLIAGRRAFALGSERLVSELPWSNSMRTWEGLWLKGRLGLKTHWTLFGAQPVVVDKTHNNHSNGSDRFYGFFGEKEWTQNKVKKVELYLFARDQDSASFNGSTGSSFRGTLGGRIVGKIKEVFFDLEAAQQLGTLDGKNVNANMLSLELRKSWDYDFQPTFRVGFDYASGDSKAGGRVETFDQLFAFDHRYLGLIDFVARQNIYAAMAGFIFKPHPTLTAWIDFHSFWRASPFDAAYQSNGGILAAATLDKSREIGQELDAVIVFKPSRHIHARVGYSHFFAGSMLKNDTATRDRDFIYGILEYTW